ncbi:hypothetical protein [Paractinoplanes rishiriensis]|uniref:Uncharacterized protein n=1 Tax=Paractinoplanes rishiriensis TaxID=1050105 RepID=A0A919MRZ7_9ACTN|nr:hypothetical protein [Actinoplanes rishiriensis]GIE97731.1 hypothetical protein Ari01nite_51960 [Actinoplanes rishiriensis]
MSTLRRRYRDRLLGVRPAAERAPASLWQRYWMSLLGFRRPPPAGVAEPAPVNPLTRPSAHGNRLRLPRFDRSGVRLAASTEADRAVDEWRAGGREITVRQSGPGEIEFLVRVEHAVPAGTVLPVEVATERDDLRYFLVFVPDAGGGAVAALRLGTTAAWFDVTVDEPADVATVDPHDAAVARSVRATPDPAMTGWWQILADRPAHDPLGQVIRDAAR